jgi:ATP-dependent Clp protease, protease subunit
MTTPVAAPIPTAYGVFSGAIDQTSTQRLFHTLTTAAANRLTVHLLFQSSGGNVADGICLYNFFKALPIDLTLYNVGSIQSIATIAYLGAKHRKVSAHAAFMIHRTLGSAQFAVAARLQGLAQSVLLDDTRSESILRQNLRLGDDVWNTFTEMHFSAEDSVKAGIAEQVEEFIIPSGTPFFNVLG